MSTYNESIAKVTTRSLAQMKANGEKISCLTSYDYTMATLVDAAGIDLILVGDSASNVMLGNATTLPITVDEMITYAKGVVKGARRAFVVVDMPFGSYQGNSQLAVANAVRIMKESGAEGVKIEGGEEIAESIRLITQAGIPVMGHLGLTPQSVNQFGGYGIRAKAEAEAQKLIADARLLQELGCFSIVLEKIPSDLAARVAQELTIPVIGIGAGDRVDGQILVAQDMLGMNGSFKPKFLRLFGNVGESITTAVADYVANVKGGTFPSASEQY